MEDWRVIPSFPRYSVSTLGRVRNDETGRLMTLLINNYGIVNVGLTRDGTQFKRSLSVLVASAFIPQVDPAFDTPINLDGERTHNYVSNLTWRPRWFAIKYFRQFKPNGPRGFTTPVEELSTHEYFPNSFEAAMKYGLLDREIFIATINRTYVWPTYQQFRVIENRY